MRIIFLILLFSLTACSSVPIQQLNDRLQTWKQSDINQIIKYWGVPSKKKEINGRFYAEWLNKESTPNNTAVSIGTGTRSRNTSIGLGLTLFDFGGTDDVCSRTVSYNEDGSIIEINWKGTKDFCYEITPDRNQVLMNKKIMDE